jgi:hypothetical protein
MKTALISVYNKQGLEEFAHCLLTHDCNKFTHVYSLINYSSDTDILIFDRDNFS